MYEIILKPNREEMLPPGPPPGVVGVVKGALGPEMMGHGGGGGGGGGGPGGHGDVEGYGGPTGKMGGGGGYYKDMPPYGGKEMSYPGRKY